MNARAFSGMRARSRVNEHGCRELLPMLQVGWSSHKALRIPAPDQTSYCRMLERHCRCICATDA